MIPESQQEEYLLRDVLYTGMTRPATIGWVTFDAMVFCIIMTAVVVGISADLLFMGVFLVLWGVSYLVEKHDPRAFRILFIWLRLRYRCRGPVRNYWGGCDTRTPLPVSRREKK